ncbi:hypothetical protein SCAR479_10394 [Seiridium cardinale]|uniref:Uncharacterized protein n=1 Tax=Seiridium cardinale TaxID=138064 RepID=A0ABR2XGR0_9PEZI
MQLIHQESPSLKIRDWGGWMDALPSLSAGCGNDILNSAIMALTASITTHKADLRPSKASYLGAYGTALRKLQVALRTFNPSNRFMVLATIICLYTAAELFQAIGPEGFIPVATHKLFAGFRGSIIFEAIYMRRRSFTSHHDWKTLPFKLQGQNIIQRLLTIAADIPPLLERFDSLDRVKGPKLELSALALSSDFRTIICHIDHVFAMEADASSYWQLFPESPESRYRFAKLSIASVYLNYWLICAICFIHLHLLRVRYGVMDPVYASVGSEEGSSPLDKAVENATNIYRSMDFVLQDEMRIQGPASRIFTARVAYDILKFDGSRSAKKLAGFRSIMERFEVVGFKIRSLPDDRPFWSLVTACRAIFSGPKAQMRKRKSIRKEIVDHKSALRSLGDIGTDGLVAIVRALLERQVFESDLKARLEFPELFQSSPERDALREASELEAVQSVRESFEQGVSDGEDDEEDELPWLNRDVKAATNDNVSAHSSNPSLVAAPQPTSAAATIPSLHPVRLSYKAQHLLLTEAQIILEECFYDFASQWLPFLLMDEKCDCAVAIELNYWSHLYRKHVEQIPLRALNLKGRKFDSTMAAINRLRHSAVHRIKLTGSDVRDLIKAGVDVALLLRDNQRAALLGEISAELSNKITSMELMKNDAEKTAVAKLKEIQKKREELDREEAAAIASMLKRDAENTATIGTLIEESVGRLLSIPRPEDVPNDGDGDADTDVDENEDDEAGEEYYSTSDDLGDSYQELHEVHEIHEDLARLGIPGCSK